MLRLLIFLLFATTSLLSFAQVHVRGYYRKNGTYVRPHLRTRPNHTVTDNYSYPGNYNPNTGRITGGSGVSADRPASMRVEPQGYYPSRANVVNTKPISTEIGTATLPDPIPISKTPTSLYAETEPNAALKVEPSYQANSKYAIPMGALVKLTPYNEYYFLAEVNGRSGYVCTCQVKKTFTKP